MLASITDARRLAEGARQRLVQSETDTGITKQVRDELRTLATYPRLSQRSRRFITYLIEHDGDWRHQRSKVSPNDVEKAIGNAVRLIDELRRLVESESEWLCPSYHWTSLPMERIYNEPLGEHRFECMSCKKLLFIIDTSDAAES